MDLWSEGTLFLFRLVCSRVDEPFRPICWFFALCSYLFTTTLLLDVDSVAWAVCFLGFTNSVDGWLTLNFYFLLHPIFVLTFIA